MKPPPLDDLLETRRRIQEHLDRIARQISIRAVRRTRQRWRPLGRTSWSPADERLYRTEIDALSFERLAEIDALTRMLERQDRAIEMEIHLQRIVGAFVSSAHGAGQFYSQKVTDARDATAKLANDDRDNDRDGPVGFESGAQRKREFAADTALQAYCLRMAAEGAAKAYEQVIGEAWKPFEQAATGPTLDRRAAESQMSAFG